MTDNNDTIEQVETGGFLPLETDSASKAVPTSEAAGQLTEGTDASTDPILEYSKNRPRRKIILKNRPKPLEEDTVKKDTTRMVKDVDIARSLGNKVQPQTLVNNIVIKVHSRQAYGMVLGRIKKKGIQPIAGLFSFAKSVNHLIRASVDDDPYADLMLIKIENHLQKFDEVIKSTKNTIMGLQQDLIEDDVYIQKMESKRPIGLTLNFGSLYALQLSRLIMQFDALIRLMMPMRHFGAITEAQWLLMLKNLTEHHRSMTNIAVNYPFYKFDREIAKDPEHLMTIKLKKRFGELPHDILTGNIKPHKFNQR